MPSLPSVMIPQDTAPTVNNLIRLTTHGLIPSIQTPTIRVSIPAMLTFTVPSGTVLPQPLLETTSTKTFNMQQAIANAQAQGISLETTLPTRANISTSEFALHMERINQRNYSKPPIMEREASNHRATPSDHGDERKRDGGTLMDLPSPMGPPTTHGVTMRKMINLTTQSIHVTRQSQRNTQYSMWKPRLKLKALCQVDPSPNVVYQSSEANNHVTADLTSQCRHHADANPELMTTRESKSDRHPHSGRTI
ncbi:hypothetical protein TIFTF001_029828 [Ficus carica]|uniref:Uncharacterized protein n=1 Tax=Ficus carica TaxID=3494 RepID=A0AA88DSC7_FICCA|nr:hypothetical protein TIFTF001_029828 [Ficus carica]